MWERYRESFFEKDREREFVGITKFEKDIGDRERDHIGVIKCNKYRGIMKDRVRLYQKWEKWCGRKERVKVLLNVRKIDG